MEDRGISTQLLVPSGSVCFSYTNAPWKLFLRKEVGMGVWPQPFGAGRAVMGSVRSSPETPAHPLPRKPLFKIGFLGRAEVGWPGHSLA